MDHPQLTYLPDGYEWALADGIYVQFRGLYAERGGLHAELQILKDAGNERRNLYWSDLNLTAQRSKTSLAKLMAQRVNTLPDWEALIEMLCHRTAIEYRRPAEAVWIGHREHPPTQYRVHPIAPTEEPSMLYGDGGSGKSYLAILMSIAIHSGQTLAGLTPMQGAVMYVDYETSEAILERRVRKVAHGFDLDTSSPMLLYYHGTLPLAKEMNSIRANILNHDIVHIIVDSASLAVGGQLEDTAAVGQFFAALRALNVSCTVISHVAKNSTHGQPTPYGSAYWRNFTRSEWHVTGSQEEGSNQLAMVLRHSKVNDEGKHPRLGFLWGFEEDRVTVAPTAIPNLPGMEHNAPLKDQAIEALQTMGGRATLNEVAQYLEVKPSTLNTMLRRNPTTFLQVGKSGRAVLWGLTTPREELL